MGQKEVDELRALIRTRALLLKQQKTAKGKKLANITMKLNTVQHDIQALDEKQR